MNNNKQDYEKLFKQAVYHLRCVSGSRNSFAPEVRGALNKNGITLYRTEFVEGLHREAYEFLKVNDQYAEKF